MINIRTGVFETNSSSVHSMVLCSANDYEDWVKGKKLYNVNYNYNGWHYIEAPLFVTPEEAAEYDSNYPYPKEHQENYWGDWELDFQDEEGNWHERQFITAEEYGRAYSCMYETFDDSFTTPGGEEVVAFGFYGHD